MIRRRRETETTTEAASVADQVAQAAEEAARLAALDEGAALLADPRLNPSTRVLADELRTEALTARLRAEAAEEAARLSARQRATARRRRVAEAAAAEAEEALTALRRARAAASPATRVLALTRGQRRWPALMLTISVALSAGSAWSLGRMAAALGGAEPVGWLAECSVTVLAVIAIGYYAHLATHDPDGIADTTRRWLWTAAGVPLAISLTLNLSGALWVPSVGVGVAMTGILCSAGAAAYGLLAHLAAGASATAVAHQTAAADATEETALAQTATAVADDDEDPAPTAATGQAWLARQADRIAEEAAAWLATRPGDGGDPGPATRVPTPVIPPTPVAHQEGHDPGHIGADQEFDPGHDPVAAPTSDPVHTPVSWPVPLPDQAVSLPLVARPVRRALPPSDRPRRTTPQMRAAQIRRAQSAQTRARVTDYYRAHPDTSVAAAAQALGVSESTIKRHRPRPGDLLTA